MAAQSSALTVWEGGLAFAAAAAAAGEGCPISGALKGNIEITVDATLE
jgi:organic hydroperoxide reductase OsmC/OhrA